MLFFRTQTFRLFVEYEKLFFQAFAIEHDRNELKDIDCNQLKDIVRLELTAYEFAEALSLRPDALFVQQMFSLIDADGNGYISFREFLNVIVIFAKGIKSRFKSALYELKLIVYFDEYLYEFADIEAIYHSTKV